MSQTLHELMGLALCLVYIQRLIYNLLVLEVKGKINQLSSCMLLSQHDHISGFGNFLILVFSILLISIFPFKGSKGCVG